MSVTFRPPRIILKFSSSLIYRNNLISWEFPANDLMLVRSFHVIELKLVFPAK